MSEQRTLPSKSEMRYQLLALLATLAVTLSSEAKTTRRNDIDYNHGLRFVSDKETSLFAGVIYEETPEDQEKRAAVMEQNQVVYDENAALTLAETDLEESVETEIDEMSKLIGRNTRQQEQVQSQGSPPHHTALDMSRRDDQTLPSQRHPVILLPGLGGSAILGSRVGDARSRVRTLWVGLSLIKDLYLDKYPLALKYDAEEDKFENEVSSLKTQVKDFGGIEGMKIIDAGAFKRIKALERIYLEDVVSALEARGYSVGQDLHGAPYDFRLIGDAHVRQKYFEDLQGLVEKTYDENGQTPVHLAGHSLGGILALKFLNTYKKDNDAWKQKYIQSFTSISAPFLGAPKALKTMLSGDNLGVSIVKNAYIAQLTSSYSCMLWMMPHVHADNQTVEPLNHVSNYIKYAGQQYNNTAPAIQGLFSAFKRDLNLMKAFEKQIYPLYDMSHPRVNINCAYGYNVGTEVGYDYKDTKHQPIINYANGDGTVPIDSLTFCEQWGNEPSFDLNIMEFEYATHEGILQDSRFLRWLSQTVHPTTLQQQQQRQEQQKKQQQPAT